MDSVPPTSKQWARPRAMRSAASAMDCKPEAQAWFTVNAGTACPMAGPSAR